MKGNDIQPCITVMNIIRILFCGRLREKGLIDIFHLWFSTPSENICMVLINRLRTANLNSTPLRFESLCNLLD